jgi:hypothetical protein
MNNLPTKEKPKIKFVKKANAWVKTYYAYDENTRTAKMVQEWSSEKPA